MSLRFAVVHEAAADFSIATELADREFVDAIKWLEDDMLADQREWIADVSGGRSLTWKGIKKLARESGVRVHGHFDGEASLPDAAAARRAILFLLTAIPDLKAVMLIRDQDDQPERRGGLNQARDQDQSGIVIIVGLAIVERESWVVSGFDPLDADESSRLSAERERLGFDPRTQSHELTACKDDNANRSPKRVLRELAGGDSDRESHCWRGTPLQSLRERGSSNGLAAYLGEVRERLAPLIGYVARD